MCDNNGRNVLHYAVQHDHGLAKFLISQGIDLNSKDKDGLTPLHLSIISYKNEKGLSIWGNTQFAISKLLISHGANINDKDNQGKTARDYAESRNLYEFVNIFDK